VIIHELIEKRGQDYADMLLQVHHQILGMHPAVQCVRKWGMPFYNLKKNLVYLDVQKGKPILGVAYAYKLPEIHPLVDFGPRKLIAHLALDPFTEETEISLITILDCAIDFDLENH